MNYYLMVDDRKTWVQVTFDRRKSGLILGMLIFSDLGSTTVPAETPKAVLIDGL
jgi:hypothetical protein